MEQRLDFLDQALRQQLKLRLISSSHELKALSSRLQAKTPDHRLALLKQQLESLRKQLTQSFITHQRNSTEQLRYTAGQLNSLSPLNTLKRGYSITRVQDKNGNLSLLRDVKALKVGQHLNTQLSHGIIESTITSIKKDSTEQ